MQCGENPIHGNTVADILATLLEGVQRGEEKQGEWNRLFFLLVLLQEGVREF